MTWFNDLKYIVSSFGGNDTQVLFLSMLGEPHRVTGIKSRWAERKFKCLLHSILSPAPLFLFPFIDKQTFLVPYQISIISCALSDFNYLILGHENTQKIGANALHLRVLDFIPSRTLFPLKAKSNLSTAQVPSHTLLQQKRWAIQTYAKENTYPSEF